MSKKVNILEQTKKLCQLYSIKPARSKGQNFLVKEEVYDDIVEAAMLEKSDEVLEVGPGLGFLTAKLANKARKIVAVELDDSIHSALASGLELHGKENVMLVHGDIMKVPFTDLGLKEGYKIVANLPYNITSIFIRTFLESANKPESIVLMLQKEVAERICAAPPKMSLLSLSVQFYAIPEIIRYVPAKNFWPAPEVDSAIIRMIVRKDIPSIDVKKFFRLAKHGFSAKRKMLKNNLACGLKIGADEISRLLESGGIAGKARAENLSLDDWLKIFGYFEEYML